MKHLELEACAVQYLRYDQRCFLVMTERGPSHIEQWGRPDVLGITADRHVIEIEVKRTISDFRANGKKRGVNLVSPWKRYFLVPDCLREKVVAEAPAGWGVMVPGEVSRFSGIPMISVVKKAAINRQAKPIDMREFMRCIRHQTGTLFTVMAENVRWKRLNEERMALP